jgi:hypothetical protein
MAEATAVRRGDCCDGGVGGRGGRRAELAVRLEAVWRLAAVGADRGLAEGLTVRWTSLSETGGGVGVDTGRERTDKSICEAAPPTEPDLPTLCCCSGVSAAVVAVVVAGGGTATGVLSS